ncbi:MAG: hypothetical protein MI723_05725, partial [Caulobacterales bacterium]|nr:hypothetical protein [Caulobacterales bacterium]
EAARTLHAAGAQLRAQSYDLQKSPWGQSVSGSRATRVGRLTAGAAPGDLADLPTLVDFSARTPQPMERGVSAVARAFADGPDQPQLAAAAGAELSLAGGPRSRYQATLDNALALAAMDAIGAAEPASTSAWDGLLGEKQTRACLKTARLNLTQCVAATHFRYEETFCVARHSLKDVGDCLDAFAGR